MSPREGEREENLPWILACLSSGKVAHHDITQARRRSLVRVRRGPQPPSVAPRAAGSTFALLQPTSWTAESIVLTHLGCPIAGRRCVVLVYIVRGRRHAERVLEEYVDHYNKERPHRGLQLHPPNGQVHGVSANGEIICRQTLGGLLREYSRAPMSAAA
jgi:hypothetical protein